MSFCIIYFYSCNWSQTASYCEVSVFFSILTKFINTYQHANSSTGPFMIVNLTFIGMIFAETFVAREWVLFSLESILRVCELQSFDFKTLFSDVHWRRLQIALHRNLYRKTCLKLRNCLLNIVSIQNKLYASCKLDIFF